MDKKTVRNIVEYELVSWKETLKRTRTWINVLGFVAIVLTLFKSYTLTVIVLLSLVILNMKDKYESGEVTAYVRKKQGIPNSTEIKKWKEKQKEQL